MRNARRTLSRELSEVVSGVEELVDKVAAALNVASLAGTRLEGLPRVLRLALYDLAALSKALGGAGILVYERRVEGRVLYIPCPRGCRPFVELRNDDGCTKVVYGCTCETGPGIERVVNMCAAVQDNA